MTADLFSAGFSWDGVATDATPSATPTTPAATELSRQRATPIATLYAPSFSTDFAWVEAGVASVASVADAFRPADLSQIGVADRATADATPETAVFGGFGRHEGHAVAGVAGVAEWRAGLDGVAHAHPVAMRRDTWSSLLADARSILALWGDDLAQAGWSTLEVFGTNVDPAHRRLDRLGLVPLLGGRQVEAIDTYTALIRTSAKAGDTMTFDRRLVATGGVPLWLIMGLECRGQAGRGRAGDSAFSATPTPRPLSTGENNRAMKNEEGWA